MGTRKVVPMRSAGGERGGPNVKGKRQKAKGKEKGKSKRGAILENAGARGRSTAMGHSRARFSVRLRYRAILSKV